MFAADGTRAFYVVAVAVGDEYFPQFCGIHAEIIQSGVEVPQRYSGIDYHRVPFRLEDGAVAAGAAGNTVNFEHYLTQIRMNKKN